MIKNGQATLLACSKKAAMISSKIGPPVTWSRQVHLSIWNPDFRQFSAAQYLLQQPAEASDMHEDPKKLNIDYKKFVGVSTEHSETSARFERQEESSKLNR